MDQESCPSRYYMNDNQQCVHYLLPPSFWTVIGSILIPLITGLSSLAGLGGGGPSLVVFIMFFNYLPKDANIIVFTSILGATLGNCVNQMSKSHNGQPIIQYKYAFVSLPIMFIGSYFGVYLNSFLPSLVICGIIVYQSAISLPKIKQRFIQSFQKQSKQILLHKQTLQRGQDIIKQQRINPFENAQNIYIFKNILLLIIIFTVLLSFRGTEKMPSMIGIQRCSPMYWIMFVISLVVVGIYAYTNMQKLKTWITSPQKQQKPMVQNKYLQIQQPAQDLTLFQKNTNDIIYYSLMAGVFSGFGLGGGLFLVPMYRGVGCQPLQATASTAFTIVVISTINCIQGMLLGVIHLQDLLYFLIISGGGSFVISVLISGYLRKIHRLSYVEYLLYILLVLAVINIPVSLLTKWVNSGYDSSLILSFGNLC